jgi:hypothetical protein
LGFEDPRAVSGLVEVREDVEFKIGTQWVLWWERGSDRVPSTFMHDRFDEFSPLPSLPLESFKAGFRSGCMGRMPVWEVGLGLRPLGRLRTSALPHGRTIAGASILPLKYGRQNKVGRCLLVESRLEEVGYWGPQNPRR